MKKTCLILNDSVQISEDKLIHLVDKIEPHWYQRNGKDFSLAEAIELVPQSQIIVSRNIDINRENLKKLPCLEAIIITSTASDRVDVGYCQESKIQVFNTPGYASQSVAEHAFALMMASVKNISALDSEVRSDNFHTQKYLAMELLGKRAGVIGLGNIGYRIASFAKCFGMEVVYYNRSVKGFKGGIQVDLQTLIKTSDVIFLTLPLNRDSFNLIGVAEFNLMKRSTFIISVSANEIINQEALANALQTGNIAGAAIDLSVENKELLKLPNLILTPMRGWYTKESIENRISMWIDTLSNYLIESANSNPNCIT